MTGYCPRSRLGGGQQATIRLHLRPEIAGLPNFRLIEGDQTIVAESSIPFFTDERSWFNIRAVGMGYIMIDSQVPREKGLVILLTNVYCKVFLLCYNERVIVGSDTNESDYSYHMIDLRCRR